MILLCRPDLIPGEPIGAFLFSICFLHHERPLEKLARFLSVRGPWSILPHFTASEIKMFLNLFRLSFIFIAFDD